MSLLPKLTMIVPTFNRQSYALRTMHYWSGSGVILHVLDGSPKELDVKLLQKIDTNVNYHHMPISIIERLKQSIRYLITEYTLLAGDDDIFLPSSLEKCINEIEVNKDLVSCMGRSLAFLSDGFEVRGWPVYEEMKEYSISQDDPIERMIYTMNPYTCSKIHSVVQTNVWKKAMIVLVEKDFKVAGLEELQFELAVSYLGKSKAIEELMLLRSSENTPIIKSQPWLKGVPDWWKEKKMKQDREVFLEIMSSRLGDGDLNNTRRIYDGTRLAMDVYTAQYNHKKSFVKKLHQKIHFGLTSLLPGNFKDFLKTVINLNPTEKKEDHISLVEAANNLEDTGVRVDFKELNQIVNIVQDFHSKNKIFDN
ncbi:MAG: TIGR00180 family glycosyltransferase [Proteobacteria bacterium]|nr:TIGR00180 family glycosyltransferase [Pseudomonadota bacterium]MBU1389477.1 TIGR00180 family glycosyltransferase [Pseudomonadota bacterium]MBU1541297.1 TIGR00180 family glycosyltransferase [Pseudomonadota bacterium]